MRFSYKIEGNLQVEDFLAAMRLMPAAAFDLHIFLDQNKDGTIAGWFYVVMGEVEIHPPRTLDSWLAPLYAAGTVYSTSYHNL